MKCLPTGDSFASMTITGQGHWLIMVSIFLPIGGWGGRRKKTLKAKWQRYNQSAHYIKDKQKIDRLTESGAPSTDIVRKFKYPESTEQNVEELLHHQKEYWSGKEIF